MLNRFFSSLTRLLNPRSWPLRFQLGLALILTLVVITYASTFLVRRYEEAIQQEDLADRSHHTVLLTQEMMGGYIKAGDIERLADFVDGTILHDPNVVYVEILESNMAGSILLQSGDGKMVTDPKHVTYQDDIFYNDDLLATIYITWDTTFIDEIVADRVARTNLRIDSLFASMVVILLLLGYILITRPLGLIDKRIRAFASLDNLSIKDLQPLELRSSREWDQVSKTINQLQLVTLERQQQADLLREARDTALEMSRMKSSLLTNLSHEFRTPLNGIIGLSQLLDTTDLDEEQQEYSASILSSGFNMLDIVDKLLDFSAVGDGTLELDIDEFDLVSLLKETIYPYQQHEEAKDIEVFYESELLSPQIISTDQAKVKKVFELLLDNAIRFTHAGSIEVRLGLAESSDDQKAYRIEVADTGIGIPPNKFEAIFESFYQVDGSLTRQQEGNGLGLSIAKGLVEVLGGKITVESELAVGSTFTFTVKDNASIKDQLDQRAAIEQPA